MPFLINPTENGVQQGRAQCLPHFYRNQTSLIKFLFTGCLFAEDFNILPESLNPAQAYRILQETLITIVNITTWIPTQLFED